ncbi:MAG: ATP-dependent helicase [Ignavibacteriaceae bacterium]|nr:ATP-dependent helicase [Ignavibacteriaceae bacterium]
MKFEKYKLKNISGGNDKLLPVDESRFTIDYKNVLNPAQYDAVSATEGAYLIIAGAGTGKTRTLVYRVARLIESGYDPSSILLLTFTRKAAREMMNRASVLLDARCSKISGGTFHSFANITLRKYANHINLNPSFTILDQGDSEDVMNLLRSQSGLISKDKRFPNKSTLLRIYSLSINTGRTFEDVLLSEFPHFYGYMSEIGQIFNIYINYKQRNNLLDYDDLLLHLLKFLTDLSPAAKNFLKGIKFVMVDEYQDTNKLQGEVTQALTLLTKNIMVVGDDAQSIYSFRGANFKNIMDFPNLFEDVKIIKLEENYRSTPYILDFANKIHEAAVEKFNKNLFTYRSGGELPAIVAALNDNLQSKFIVDQVLELREQGVPLKEIAVLFRSSFFSFDLEIELNKANIPFVKFGGMKFVETAHIKDAIAFLRIALNPKDMVSWYRVLLLHEGIGPKSAQRIMDLITEGKVIPAQDPESNKIVKGYDKVYGLFDLLFRLSKKSLTPTDMAQMAIDYYMPLFHNKYDDFNKRKKDLEIFLNITENYHDLETLLADMAIEPPIDSVIDIGDEDKQDEFLTLSTIHSAKGLEWHSVFIIHAIDGFFPFSKAFDSLDNLEEERRLMYVAVTRAKQNLFISYPMNIYDREAGTTFSKPSRFLNNITSSQARGLLLEE